MNVGLMNKCNFLLGRENSIDFKKLHERKNIMRLEVYHLIQTHDKATKNTVNSLIFRPECIIFGFNTGTPSAMNITAKITKQLINLIF